MSSGTASGGSIRTPAHCGSPASRRRGAVDGDDEVAPHRFEIVTRQPPQIAGAIERQRPIGVRRTDGHGAHRQCRPAAAAPARDPAAHRRIGPNGAISSLARRKSPVMFLPLRGRLSQHFRGERRGPLDKSAPHSICKSRDDRARSAVSRQQVRAAFHSAPDPPPRPDGLVQDRPGLLVGEPVDRGHRSRQLRQSEKARADRAVSSASTAPSSAPSRASRWRISPALMQLAKGDFVFCRGRRRPILRPCHRRPCRQLSTGSAGIPQSPALPATISSSRRRALQPSTTKISTPTT